jgi:hypothetical protein
MSHRRFAVSLVLLSCAAIALVTPLSGSEISRPEPRLSTASRSIVVTTTAELLAALTLDNGDLTIFVQRGTYLLDHAIQVPDNVALIGEGEMLYDGTGLPTGFAPESRTVIAAMPGVSGNFVTLENGASLQGLVIQEAVRPAATGGAVVAVTSRRPADSVSAQVGECEIISHNPPGGNILGVTGRGLLAITLNPRPINGALSHAQSYVSVHMTQSIIRTPAGGSGVLASNNAGGSHVEMHLRQNVIGGESGGAGGASRPDSVAGATTLIQSHGNLYRAEITSLTSVGWNMHGGPDAPAAGIPEETFNNRLSVHSVDDRIEGFARAITAFAGRRNNALSAPSSSNELELILHGTRIRSTVTDLVLRGASSVIAGMAAGNGNELRATIRNVTGSGPRANAYTHALPDPDLGTGNRLVITGSLNAFTRTNEAILPMPGAQFFTAGR